MRTNITIDDVIAAKSIVKKYLTPTPLLYSAEFSEATGNEVFFKLEIFQRTHAFKARGALNKVFSLSPEERKKGIIAASSGNHALGVAYAASLLGVEAWVVMPDNAPDKKINLAKGYGARVLLQGKTYDQALAHAQLLAIEQEKVLVPSFDDPMIIAGQGTIALEIFDSLNDVDLVIAPIGGGGLVSGLALTLSESGHPGKILGVQAQGAASMLRSLEAGYPIKLDDIQTFADGIAVQRPGEIPFELIKRFRVEVCTVTDAQIYEALVRLMRDMSIIVEPAAAASAAALLFHKELHNQGKKVCCIVTGSNISTALLGEITAKSQ